ncbi:LIM domain-binding protein 2-like [Pollicipes pollicipes]|uniref:LIM domain-binding protein 2-like n=1 Tax=Pollicipes pollicipes TaxID=41117 RepID=UPI0018856F40|nr:LIM domain-binding protein 2-like [Pollicipes pollicipes]
MGGPFAPLGPPHGPHHPAFGGPFPPHGGPPFGPQHMGGPMHGPGGPMGPGHMGPGHMGPDRMDHGRHTPYFNQPDYRIHELNKRLQQKSEDSDSLWWDAFATEFFEDDAHAHPHVLFGGWTQTIHHRPARSSRATFGAIFEGGVTELYFSLRHPKESFHTTSITLDCDQATMVTHHGKPLLAKVCTEGRFIVEFTFDDLMRINYASSLEPMQELMTRHKASSLQPARRLKTTLFQSGSGWLAPPGRWA